MASRAFITSNNQITSSGEHIASKRQYTKYKTIYNDTLTNSTSAQKKWNKTYVIKNCKETQNAELVYAASHADLLDITKGKRYANPLLNGSEAAQFNSYIGSFTQIQLGCIKSVPLTLPIKYDDISSPAIIIPQTPIVSSISFPNLSQSDATDNAWNTNQVGSDIWPGYLLDPYGILFDNTCDVENIHSMEKRFTHKAFIDYRWNIEYWRIASNKSLSGISYPEKVQFGLQATNLTEDTALKFAPLPPLTNVPPTIICNAGISGSILQAAAADNATLQLNYWCGTEA